MDGADVVLCEDSAHHEARLLVPLPEVGGPLLALKEGKGGIGGRAVLGGQQSPRGTYGSRGCPRAMRGRWVEVQVTDPGPGRLSDLGRDGLQVLQPSARGDHQLLATGWATSFRRACFFSSASWK